VPLAVASSNLNVNKIERIASEINNHLKEFNLKVVIYEIS
tara:strand:- start:23525 stop:23644 length:120 start_codon:yes stop_codon:yes gene_type:complete